MRKWIFSWPGILVVVGILAILLGVEQHFIGVLAIPHFAIFLGVVGVLLLIPGIVMSARHAR
jgi:hypothetical protein